MKRRAFISALGAAVASSVSRPLAVHAQGPAIPVIGFLGSGSPEQLREPLAAFHAGLRDLGYIEGRNLRIEYRWAKGEYDRLPALALDLVQRRVAMIVAFATLAAKAAKAATASIPIVFNIGTDPVQDGLVTAINHPGGNATGITNITTGLAAKRLQILRELVPAATVIALLVNPATPTGELDDADAAARATERQLVVLRAGSESDFEPAFATLVQRGAGALIVASDPFFLSRRDQLVALAARHSVPAIYQFRAFVQSGGLLSYGTVQADAYRQVSVYVARILKGDNPADLPVMQPTKFELVINLRAAKALGLDVPPMLLAIVDEVIE
jgi:putative tryptophan/tyrosine transport system substrate-binding protein